MQPYFLPYLGYFQLIQAVDTFVIYNNIQYTKKGWINRNRFLMNNVPHIFTIPLKNDSDFLNINQRFLAKDYLKYNKKTLRKIESSYKKSPNFNKTYEILEKIFLFDESDNLFDFVFNSINCLTRYLDIKTNIIKSSDVIGDVPSLKSKHRVINLCTCLSATDYINPIGGVDLYDKDEFSKSNINLRFHKINNISYPQFNNYHTPYLSILDVLMFNDVKTIKDNLLNEYKIL